MSPDPRGLGIEGVNKVTVFVRVPSSIEHPTK